MNILFLNYEFPPLGGGAGHATWCLLERFRKRSDVRVDLITSAVGPARTERWDDRITLRFLDTGKLESLHFQSGRDILAYCWAAHWCGRRLMREHSYDLCHAFFGIPCGFLARQFGLPYIVSLRGSDVPFYSDRFRSLDRLAFREVSKRIWKRAEFVVANSEGLRDLALRSVPSQRIEVIPNGVDTEMFRPGAATDGRLRVLCVARLIRRKRIDLLIRAMGSLRDVGVTLTLVGSGNEQDRLVTLARAEGVKDRVHFAGLVPHEKLPDIYRQHDVFVLPSENEGMSNTALEALASGLPLVMTETGGASELLVNGRNGFSLRKGSVEDVRDALRRYAADRALVHEHGRHSRKVAETMSWDQVADAYLDLYRRVVEGRRR